MAGIIKGHIQLGDSATASQNFVITSQSADGTMKLSRGNNGATTQDILAVNAAGLVTLVNGEVLTASKLQSGTAVATTSGTSIDFAGIPSWVKRITLNLNGVSLTGTAHFRIQLGVAAGVEASGYAGSYILTGTAFSSAINFTVGFELINGAAANVAQGAITFTLLNAATNTWAAAGMLGFSNTPALTFSTGSKSLAATLDRVRLTTTNGTDTFDAGSINILWE